MTNDISPLISPRLIVTSKMKPLAETDSLLHRGMPIQTRFASKFGSILELIIELVILRASVGLDSGYRV